jgi:2,3-dihydroxybiphenyl 1,2-dioxygenase
MIVEHPALSSLFGLVRMGYVVAESEKFDEWRRFAADGLGLHVDQPDSHTLTMRVDDHQRRIIILKGPAEDVAAIGWEMASEAALELALQRLEKRGSQIRIGSADEARSRGVECFWSVSGPKGLPVELYVRPLITDEPLKMKASGFVTGAGGLGHAAITTRRPRQMEAFWQEVFDARLTDHINEPMEGIVLELTFLRLNERHHSIAAAATRGLRFNPVRTQIHHMNLQAASLEDVMQGYLRCRAMGCRMANSIGQHTNDKELSFYVATPSDWEIELGWNPIVIDEDSWQPAVYDSISLWGHRPENLTMAYRLRRAKTGVVSLAHTEFTA